MLLNSNSLGSQRIGTFTVAVGEELDLGTVALVEPGWVAVGASPAVAGLLRTPSGERRALWLHLRGADGSPRGGRSVQTLEDVAGPFQPGTYDAFLAPVGDPEIALGTVTVTSGAVVNLP